MLENYKDKKSIIIYFSRADENYGVGYIDKGNTEVVAEYISAISGANMIKIEPANPYSKDYNTCIEEARLRQTNHDAPIINPPIDISPYEVIYIGSPVYWSNMPEELVTAINYLDFNGKFIRPFVTHEGSGLGNIPNQIKEICQGGTVLDALAIRGSAVKNSQEQVEAWI